VLTVCRRESNLHESQESSGRPPILGEQWIERTTNRAEQDTERPFLNRLRQLNRGEDAMPRSQTIEFALSPRPDRDSEATGERQQTDYPQPTSEHRPEVFGSPRNRSEFHPSSWYVYRPSCRKFALAVWLNPSHANHTSHHNDAKVRNTTSHGYDASHAHYAHYAPYRDPTVHQHHPHLSLHAHQTPRFRRVSDAARDRVTRRRPLLPGPEAAANTDSDNAADADHHVAPSTNNGTGGETGAVHLV
jgi:hypothetical protein